MSHTSRTSNQEISEDLFWSLYNILQNYRDTHSYDNDTSKQQAAIVTIINDFTSEVLMSKIDYRGE